MNIKSIISHAITHYNDYRTSFKHQKYNDSHVQPHILSGSQLSKDEKRAVSEIWGEIVPNLDRGFNYINGIKCLIGKFDSLYLPSSYYSPYIVNVLNNPAITPYISHKSMLELIYGDYIALPNTLVRTYSGKYLNKQYIGILPEEAIKIISVTDKPILYKPAIDSMSGNGIKLYTESDKKRLCDLILSGEISRGGIDFVLQELVPQSVQTKKFNPSSLNCFRITTLNINNKTTVCNTVFKCGPTNSIVDNIGSGKRGVIVGVHPDGTLYDFGFYGNGEKSFSHNGQIFKEARIEHFQDVVEAAIRLHKNTFGCGIIGWDIALNSDNVPVLIEGNTHRPGISLEQMCNGPVFGERTFEVIDYVKKHRAYKPKTNSILSWLSTF